MNRTGSRSHLSHFSAVSAMPPSLVRLHATVEHRNRCLNEADDWKALLGLTIESLIAAGVPKVAITDVMGARHQAVAWWEKQLREGGHAQWRQRVSALRRAARGHGL